LVGKGGAGKAVAKSGEQVYQENFWADSSTNSKTVNYLIAKKHH
jgi:hypothetical protein